MVRKEKDDFLTPQRFAPANCLIRDKHQSQIFFYLNPCLRSSVPAPLNACRVEFRFTTSFGKFQMAGLLISPHTQTQPGLNDIVIGKDLGKAIIVNLL